MRLPTPRELLFIAVFWILVLLEIYRSIQGVASKASLLLWIILGLMHTYQLFNAKAYAEMKAKETHTNACLRKKFGRWHRLVQWSPTLFFFAMILLAMPTRSMTLVFLGVAGFLIGSIWLSLLVSNTEPE